MVFMPTHLVTVGGIVENEVGEILIVKTIHGGWVFPGGQVEVGENLIDALRREVKEESGIDVDVSYMIGVYSNTGEYKWYDGITDVPTKINLDFLCQQIGGVLTTSEETSESCWVDKNVVLDYIKSEAIRARYEVYLNYNGKTSYMEYVTKPTFDKKLERTI